MIKFELATTILTLRSAHTRTDALNLTNIFDNVTPANNAALWYSPSNRLQNADGPWGSETFYYDGVGNRIEHRATPPGGSQTISTLGYPATSNRVTQITQNATTVRSIGYDAAGNITSDSRLGSVYAYTYNHANRLKTVAYEGNLKGTYTYNGLHQLIKRVVTNSGNLDGTTHYVHDRAGNVIAELNAAGATVREYIWLPEAEIAPTAASRAQIDRPLAVVDGVDTATPATYYVHPDHLHRPIRLSNAAKSFVWSAEYQPWGAVQSLSGALTLDLRFPGQWFQLEAGLHYNWHRHYDPSLGRYIQPDPLGFVDGPSVYGYAGGAPVAYVDPDGQIVWILGGAAAGFLWDYLITKLKEKCGCKDSSSTLGPLGNAALGAASTASAPLASKTEKALGGGGPSQKSTSSLSRLAHKLWKKKLITPTTKRILRHRLTRSLSYLVPGGVGLIIGKDLYDLLDCVRGQ